MTVYGMVLCIRISSLVSIKVLKRGMNSVRRRKTEKTEWNKRSSSIHNRMLIDVHGIFIQISFRPNF